MGVFLDLNKDSASPRKPKHCFPQTHGFTGNWACLDHPHSAPSGKTSVEHRSNHGTEQSSVGLMGTEEADSRALVDCIPTGKLGDRRPLLTESLVCARCCAGHFTCVISFDRHENFGNTELQSPSPQPHNTGDTFNVKNHRILNLVISSYEGLNKFCYIFKKLFNIDFVISTQ